MGALTIAFDTTIVGALALPWVALVVHLFFFRGENSIVALLRWVRKQNQPAVAGVLLFAITYSLGSGVSRIAQDFFNDDDLNLQLPTNPPLLIRVGVTEYRILASVYCQNAPLLYVRTDNPEGRSTPGPGAGTDPLTSEIMFFKSRALPPDFVCRHILSWALFVPQNKDEDRVTEYEKDNWRYNIAADIFGLQEDALMEKGADYTVRLRQLHDQVMVLRGAAFNGVLAFSLCLFAWGGQVRCQKPRSALRWALAAVPGIYLALTLLALLHHLFERGLSDPPFMEYTLLLLGVSGAWLVWWRPPERQPEARRYSQQVLSNPVQGHVSPADPAQGRSAQDSSSQGHSLEATRAGSGKKTRKRDCWQSEPWRQYVALSLILTGAAIFGWWSTEVLYAEQVIYSYNSQGLATAQK